MKLLAAATLILITMITLQAYADHHYRDDVEVKNYYIDANYICINFKINADDVDQFKWEVQYQYGSTTLEVSGWESPGSRKTVRVRKFIGGDTVVHSVDVVEVE